MHVCLCVCGYCNLTFGMFQNHHNCLGCHNSMYSNCVRLYFFLISVLYKLFVYLCICILSVLTWYVTKPGTIIMVVLIVIVHM